MDKIQCLQLCGGSVNFRSLYIAKIFFFLKAYGSKSTSIYEFGVVFVNTIPIYVYGSSCDSSVFRYEEKVGIFEQKYTMGKYSSHLYGNISPIHICPQNSSSIINSFSHCSRAKVYMFKTLKIHIHFIFRMIFIIRSNSVTRNSVDFGGTPN